MGGDDADLDGRNDTTVNFDVETTEEVERVFAALSQGGKVEMPPSESPVAYTRAMSTHTAAPTSSSMERR